MKVSVLMPVYNGEKYLQESIDSILKQTYSDFELIIIDDGSTDNSSKIIRMNSDRDKRIVYLRNEKNSGICITLNRGLEVARGEYIVRMDCDDIAETNRIMKQVAFMDTHPEYGMAGSKIRIFGEGTTPYIFDFDEDWRMCLANMIFATCSAHPAVIIRNKVIKEHNLYYDDRFRGIEDFYMWWQLAKFSKITNLQECLLNYRIHKNQITQKKVDADHFNMSQSFFEERLNFLQITLTQEQKLLVLRYIFNDYPFNDEEISSFIDSCKKILSDLQKSHKELLPYAKLAIAKAISLCVTQSQLPLQSIKKYYTQAYRKGCMPTKWFIKSRIRQIIGI